MHARAALAEQRGDEPTDVLAQYDACARAWERAYDKDHQATQLARAAAERIRTALLSEAEATLGMPVAKPKQEGPK